MCCLFATLVFIGPRAGILVWWLIDPDRWRLAFDNFLWAWVGLFLAPWTTLMWVAIFPGGVTGFDWIWLVLGILADITSWFGGGWSGRRRYAAAT